MKRYFLLFLGFIVILCFSLVAQSRLSKEEELLFQKITGVSFDDVKSVKTKFQKIEVLVQVPDPSYWIRIVEIRKVGNEIWVWSEVSNIGDSGNVAPQFVSEARDSLVIQLPDLPVKHLVSGRACPFLKGKNEAVYLFLNDLRMEDRDKIAKQFKSGEVWFFRNCSLFAKIIEVLVQVPDPSYGIRIVEIRKVGNEIWVWSEVSNIGDSGNVAPQFVSEARDSLAIQFSDLPIKHLVSGTAWPSGSLKNEEVYLFLAELRSEERDKIAKQFKSGEVWFFREGPLSWKLIEVLVQVPDPSYGVRIAEIRKVGNEIWVLSEEVERNTGGDVSPQVVSEARDSLSIRLPDLPIKHLVSGTAWPSGSLKNEEVYLFLAELRSEERDKIAKQFKSGEVWFKWHYSRNGYVLLNGTK